MALSEKEKKLKDQLELFLITYNRCELLASTLGALLSENSPVRNCNLTILDNDSTDGTLQLLTNITQTHQNVKYIRNKKNIGGNANALHAYELATKEYVWLLCDDDLYDFSGWNEVEQAMEQKVDIICVSDFVLEKRTTAELLLQLSFIPANILRSELLTPTMLRMMYDSISTMFPQLCPVIEAIHTGKKIQPISKGIVHYREDTPNRSTSYVRGENATELFQRQKNLSWAQGFCEMISQLRDRKAAQEAFYKGLRENYENLDVLIRFCAKRYANFQQMPTGLLIASQLSLSKRIYFYFIFFLKWIQYKLFPKHNSPINFYVTDTGVNISLFKKIKTKNFSKPNNKC